MKAKKPSARPKRNWAARAARNQKAGVMKDRRQPRGGAKNKLREDLDRFECYAVDKHPLVQ